jgi:hypothetical protein
LRAKGAERVDGDAQQVLYLVIVGDRVPVVVVVVPHCKPQLAPYPAFTASLDTLRGMRVRVLFDPAAPYESRDLQHDLQVAYAAAVPSTIGTLGTGLCGPAAETADGVAVPAEVVVWLADGSAGLVVATGSML